MVTAIDVPELALRFGFANDPIGTHGSRTLMLDELRTLLSVCPPSAGLEDYRSVVVEGNVLLKNTFTGRQQTFRALRELYALDREVLLFRALRELWNWDAAAQPLLALLSAGARDPILRATAETILGTETGGRVTPQQLARAVRDAFPGRYSPGLLDHMGRNVASSWRQSGHLSGHLIKVRSQPESTPAAVAYALLLGFLCDVRGERLMQTVWVRLLDAPLHVLRDQSVTASQRGWIEYRHSGGVTDVNFSYLLRDVGGDW